MCEHCMVEAHYRTAQEASAACVGAFSSLTDLAAICGAIARLAVGGNPAENIAAIAGLARMGVSLADVSGNDVDVLREDFDAKARKLVEEALHA